VGKQYIRGYPSMAISAKLALLAAAVQCAAAFLLPTNLVSLRTSAHARAAAVPALRMQKGFGATPPAKKVSEVAKDRKRVSLLCFAKPLGAVAADVTHIASCTIRSWVQDVG
jgi:hypothetical protein